MEKVWSEDLLAISGYDGLKSLKQSHCDSRFIVNSGKSINLKSRFDALLFIRNDFLQLNGLRSYFRYHCR